LRAAIAAKDGTSLQRLLDAYPVADRQREEVLALPRLFGGFETLERAAAVVSNEVSKRALDNLHRVLAVLGVYGIDEYVTIDLGELRGFDYHTGLIFQGFLTGFGRAVCAGGRYDGLTARYGFPAPATGFSCNLFNLLCALDHDLDGRADASIDILLFCPGTDKAPAQRLATALRSQGYSVARDIIARDRAASFEYARRMHFRTLLIMDATSDGLTLLHLADGRETPLSLQAVLNGECRL
jgi:ATP phosphoribosyltransferase regulatory subunit